MDKYERGIFSLKWINIKILNNFKDSINNENNVLINVIIFKNRQFLLYLFFFNLFENNFFFHIPIFKIIFLW